MKRAMVYILAMTMVFSVMLSGCGENRTNEPATVPTDSPVTTVVPENMTPDTEDGVVKDRDGVITGSDTGDSVLDTERRSAAYNDMTGSAAAKSGTATGDVGNGTAVKGTTGGMKR